MLMRLCCRPAAPGPPVQVVSTSRVQMPPAGAPAKVPSSDCSGLYVPVRLLLEQ